MEKLREAMSEVSRGRTTIIIAHRFATVRNARRMTLIDEGRVAAVSTPAELAHRFQ